MVLRFVTSMLFDVSRVKHGRELTHYLESHCAFILAHQIHVILSNVMQDSSLFEIINKFVLQ